VLAAKKFLGRTVEFVVEDVVRGAGWTGERFWFSANSRSAASGRLERRSLVRAVVRGSEGSVLTGVVI